MRTVCVNQFPTEAREGRREKRESRRLFLSLTSQCPYFNSSQLVSIFNFRHSLQYDLPKCHCGLHNR